MDCLLWFVVCYVLCAVCCLLLFVVCCGLMCVACGCVLTRLSLSLFVVC